MECKIRSLYLCVTDMDRAIRFYEDFFERPAVKRDEIYSVFEIGGFRLGLFAFEKKGEEHRFGSNCLPSVEVESLAVLQKKLNGLKSVFPLQKIGRNWVSDFEDSEGNHIELTAPVRAAFLTTERLELIPLTAEQLGLWAEDLPALERELDCVYSGEPMEGFLRTIVAGQREITAKDPERWLWHSFWLLLRKQDRTVVGSADFKNVPGSGGEVELGYGLGGSHEHQGYMTEAVRAMAAWALEQPDVSAVTAETERENLASQRVLARCGFSLYRSGESLWWRRGEGGT